MNEIIEKHLEQEIHSWIKYFQKKEGTASIVKRDFGLTKNTSSSDKSLREITANNNMTQTTTDSKCIHYAISHDEMNEIRSDITTLVPFIFGKENAFAIICGSEVKQGFVILEILRLDGDNPNQIFDHIFTNYVTTLSEWRNNLEMSSILYFQVQAFNAMKLLSDEKLSGFICGFGYPANDDEIAEINAIDPFLPKNKKGIP